MTQDELTTIEGVAREIIDTTTIEIETSNIMTDDTLIRWLENAKKLAETMLWLCDEVKQVEQRTREQVAADIRAVDGFEWALAGQQAGNDAAMIALGER